MTNTTISIPGTALALEVSRLHAAYERVEVLHGIDLHIYKSETLAVLGANGAGKSTLMQALAGLVTARGSVSLGGHDISSLPSYQRARHGFALVPEIRGNLFPALSVKDNLRVGLRQLDPGDAHALDEQIHCLFPILKERSDALSGMLSGGEQQMLAIALALGRRPSVLMLDEPTQGLAPAVFDVLHSAFKQLKQQGLAILLAEQNLSFARRCADRFIILAGGKVSLRGDTSDMTDSQRLMTAYMGHS